MLKCISCGRELTHNEVGLTKKLINRGATQFLCIDCLAHTVAGTREDLDKKIIEFKELGCTLFS